MKYNHLLPSRYLDWLAPVMGGTMTLAYAPFDAAFWVFPALLFLFVSWLVLSPGRAALRGFLFGLGLFGSGVSWVFISVYYFGGRDIILSILATLVFVFFWALFPALTGYLSAKLRPDKADYQLVSMPLLWVSIEYLRGTWVLNGFPWLQIAYSQIETPLIGYAPVIGVYGTGLIVALNAMLLLTAMIKRRYLWRYLGMVAVLWMGGYYLKNIAWTTSAGEALKVTLIQGNISQDRKWAKDNRDATLKLYESITREHWDSDIVIWPETSIPAYYAEVKDSFLKGLEQQALTHDTEVIVGLPIKDKAQSALYNSVLVLGKTAGVYRKNHLLPFGEYMPLQPVSGYLLNFLNLRLGNFASGGDDQKLLMAAGYRFITSICYEDVFPLVSVKVLEQAAFLVNVTNDAWFGDSIEPYQHMQIARMRAIETGRYLLRATNTGLTGIVDPQGKIIAQAKLFQTAAVSGEIVPLLGVTPYVRFGDKLIVFLMVIGLICVAINGFDKFDARVWRGYFSPD
ncbi:MAG: apolipoprotein N-acyltransferase [Gammaproteobacteria bacterium HGW-Gammaproteobacteria-3]|nr:MAG: apolipoprotein N-acyltransferase [Gammaproteobacteria bacterium HGW-Gammaproteobacteria-3]